MLGILSPETDNTSWATLTCLLESSREGYMCTYTLIYVDGCVAIHNRTQAKLNTLAASQRWLVYITITPVLEGM